MIIVKSPLRITFGGGGTDVLSYANEYGGACISATINRYVYIMVNHMFTEGINLKYSSFEEATDVRDIQHPIFREAIAHINLATPQIEIASMADVPSNGAGLGNSGAFTVALLKALYSYKNKPITQQQLAEQACDININILKTIQGKQDEYASAFGGINLFEFETNGSVNTTALALSHEKIIELEESLMLFYTGLKHNTHSILSYQDRKTKEGNADIIQNLHELKAMAYKAKEVLETGSLYDFGSLLNFQWKNKEERMPQHNDYLSHLHTGLLNNAAYGAKIVGSGNGGFFLVCAENRQKIRNYMQANKLQELIFSIDFEGCKRLI